MPYLACVLQVCYIASMKTLDLRDADRQLSNLVREIEETGEGVLVLRDGKPAIRMLPAEQKPARSSAERQKAVERLTQSLKNPGNSNGSPRLTRDQMHER